MNHVSYYNQSNQILDICAVSVTKSSIENLNDLKKIELFKKLKSYDLSCNTISYSCALLEKVSDTRGKMNINELRANRN